MTSDRMSAALRPLLIYIVCLPLALFLGFQIANPDWRYSSGVVAVVLFVLAFPLFMRFHHPLLVLAWNASIAFAFLPGNLQLWIVMAAVSITISLAQRMLNNKNRFLSAPEITRPLIVFAVIVLVTAKMTGGIGLRSFGGDVYGGQRYFFVLMPIVGYFALTAKRIPREQANLYVALFFLSGVTSVVGDFYLYTGPVSRYIYLFFSVNSTAENDYLGATRYLGVATGAVAVFSFFLARFGIQGIFNIQKPWRILSLASAFVGGLFGGFRLVVITMFLLFALQFLAEKMHRTKLFPILILLGVFTASCTLPFLERMPMTFQRAFSFLPVKIDPVARADADASSEWRIRMWKAVLPEVPKYLLLGKGYALSSGDLSAAKQQAEGNPLSDDATLGAAAVGDYHSGPLSLVIPFGIWGSLGFLWILGSGWRVLLRNYRYGDAELKVINSFLLVAFTAHILIFFFIFGSLHTDTQVFVGLVGLSVSLNGGVARRPVSEAMIARSTPLLFRGSQPAFGARTS
jgi:hypothetical protein